MIVLSPNSSNYSISIKLRSYDNCASIFFINSVSYQNHVFDKVMQAAQIKEMHLVLYRKYHVVRRLNVKLTVFNYSTKTSLERQTFSLFPQCKELHPRNAICRFTKVERYEYRVVVKMLEIFRFRRTKERKGRGS